MSIGDIVNFLALDERLATAGQPTERELAELKEEGFEVVVNLGLLDPRYCLPDEAGSVATLGMTYHHVPVDFEKPAVADFERFARVLRESGDQKLFVHCALNYRASCFTALLFERELRWSREQADAHIQRLWEPNAVWQAFIEKVRESSARR